MKKALILLVVFLLFSYCTYLKKPLSGDEFIYKLQFFKAVDKKLITQEDSTNIFYRENITIYEKPYHYLFLKYNTNNKSDVTTIDTVKNELKYHYLVADNSGPYGIWLDSLAVKSYRRVNVDSFQNNDLLKKLGLHNLKHYVLSSTVVGKDPNLFVEQYTVKDKPDGSYFDTICFYFNKTSKIRYSMDADFEKIKKAKLYKEVFIYNPTWDGLNHDSVPRREFNLELKEIPENERMQQVLDKYLIMTKSDSKK